MHDYSFATRNKIYETKTFNENFAKKIRTCMPFAVPGNVMLKLPIIFVFYPVDAMYATAYLFLYVAFPRKNQNVRFCQLNLLLAGAPVPWRVWVSFSIEDRRSIATKQNTNELPIIKPNLSFSKWRPFVSVQNVNFKQFR